MLCFGPPEGKKETKGRTNFVKSITLGYQIFKSLPGQQWQSFAFGAKMDLAKIRTANNVVIAWRLRLFIRTSHVSSLSCSMSSWLRLHLEPSQPETLVPVRPTCLLAGDIDLPDDKAIQIL